MIILICMLVFTVYVYKKYTDEFLSIPIYTKIPVVFWGCLEFVSSRCLIIDI